MRTDGNARVHGFPRSRSASRDLNTQQEGWFEEWWVIYWRRAAKKAARSAFAEHVKTEERFLEIMAATRAQSAEMLAKEARYRPYGATWLNDERWQDEINKQQKSKGDDYPEL